LGHPYKFQRVLRLGSVTARHLVVGVSQTLRRWTAGATCVWQGDHHVGQWPTFLVCAKLVGATSSDGFVAFTCIEIRRAKFSRNYWKAVVVFKS